jgi:hypothetical protein
MSTIRGDCDVTAPGASRPEAACSAADNHIVDAAFEPCWTFGRDEDRLSLRREETRTGVNLVVAGEGVPRVFSFPDIERLVHFQSDMEAFLLRTGWSLVDFAPERRTGGDRRTFPRMSERRRWWTDARRLLLPARGNTTRQA